MTPTEQSILRGVTPALTLTGATETLNHTEFYTADQLLAAVREAVAGKWLPIESAPKDDQILAAIKVRNKIGKTWWEHHIIVIDSETGTISDMDFHHGWEADDYSHWRPLPTAPQGDANPQPQDAIP
jgi:hypothetical protein